MKGGKKVKIETDPAYLMTLWLDSIRDRITDTASFGGDGFYAECVAQQIKEILDEVRTHLDVNTFKDWRPE